MTLTVAGVVFKARRKPGDFKGMPTRPEYANSVLIFSEHILDMLFDSDNGGGTAAIRKSTWPNAQTPQAVGIPSQETEGFHILDRAASDVMQLAPMRLLSHLK